MLFSLLLAVSSASVALATPVTVQVQHATIFGDHNATTGVDRFRGVRYGSSERFRRAKPVSYAASTQFINASWFGPACPQIKGTNALAVDYGIYGTDEDCTLLDLYRPHTNPTKKLLPVMVWLHGGALTQGAASHYPGEGIVQQSSEIGLPVITVILNYRLAAWGFLGGDEAAANGALNLGLYDQRLALDWVQKYIGNFGGDKDKVTLFGQSSGAMSIAYHMLDVNTKLFRGAILESGTSTSVPSLPTQKYNGNYEALVKIAGCDLAANRFECLRTLDRDLLINATNILFGQPALYGSRPWGVSIDGEIIPESPSVLTARGQLARIPFIAGNVRDEGTIFVKPQATNTTDDFHTFLEKDYLNRNATFFQNATSISTIDTLYPADPAFGSPYGTENQTFWGPQFKRAAATYGDIHFHWARRNFLSIAVSRGVKCWSYLFDQITPGNAPWQGVFHSAEIPYVFMQIDPSQGALYNLAQQILGYWVSFAWNLDPAYHSNPIWTPYVRDAQNIVFDADVITMQPDTFRLTGTDFIGSISDQLLEAKS